LLDQALVAGVGNIYASEALFRARLSPGVAANRLTAAQVKRLWRAIRGCSRRPSRAAARCRCILARVKRRAFYFGRAPGAPDFYEERLRFMIAPGNHVRAAAPIRRITQAARSTYYCPHCQKTRE